MKIILTTSRHYPFDKPYADSLRFEKILEALTEAGNEILIVGKNNKLKFEQKKNVFLIPSSSHRFIGEMLLLALAPIYMSKIIKITAPDVIYCYSIFYSLFLRYVKKRDYKIHLDILGIEHKEKNKSGKTWLLSKILASLEMSSVKKADLITTVNYAHKKIISGFTKKPIVVLRDAVEDKYLKSTKSSHNSKELIFVGSIANRRLDDLFRALQENNEKLSGLRVKIVGDGKDLDFYKNAAKKINFSFEFCGYVPHERALGMIERASFCFSDDWSTIGFPSKVFEYMGMGKASIVEDTSATREIIEDGKTGILYNSPSDLGLKISRLMNDKGFARKIESNAFKVIKFKHTWSIRKKELVKIYKGLK
ncbi:MAG: UDP-D-galactose:(glucosyl)lipopolysaccharide-1,6-D-galactosyltransferase [candidate division WS2 bacterium ADurb.Bin280]|uniref:UDP-D-galactose:(Glucosyl)lipopolysaccharide-1, 6-D-galactosyltransferase n=1 Tax=candidate division WS2 bacterium ADurb.Bin280 TaxID=1852829 RepID=A0A1V5SBA3_9BACT|nr:MAG: UDP-D-galactose:(glucosyl)lipopolysaccharide-1,6-D-galactosyltransferase [candidate division WS2 bacterium ADurb.Bin280]